MKVLIGVQEKVLKIYKYNFIVYALIENICI